MSSGAAAKGAIAGGHQVTVDAAAQILADGGNAFDAVIAALWAACVAEPVLASPGGGGFLMAWTGGQAELIDFFVQSPRTKRSANDVEFSEVHADFGTATQAFHIGNGASATPGFVPGLFAAHGRYGSLPMTRLVEPAIEAARTGVVVTPFQGYLFEVVAPILTWTEAARALFSSSGTLLADGGTLKNPDLANVIELLAKDGVQQATEGDVAKAMLAGQQHSGYLRRQDLAEYRVEVRQPIIKPFAGSNIYLNPLPALGGGLIAAMLAGVGASAKADPIAVARATDIVDRAWRAAPDRVGQLAGLSTTEPAGPSAPRGTTHVSVIDAKGNAAAATVSNGEGNGRLVPGSGFMVNNMLGEEDVNPTGFHNWPTNQRLGSMMAPTICAGPNDRLLALGSGGSNRIRTAILQVLVNRLIADRPINEAVLAPRQHVEKGRLDFEDFYADADRAALLAAFDDHRVWPERNLYFGGVHAVERDSDGQFLGLGDIRREGVFATV